MTVLRRVGFALLLAACAAALLGGAGATNAPGPDAYGYVTIDNVTGGLTFAWQDIVGQPGTTNIPGWFGDDCKGPFPIGFPFRFYGQTYTNVYLNSKGTTLFDACYIDYVPDPMPSAGEAQAFIASFWMDLSPELPGCVGASIDYQTSGVAPYRVFTVQWTNLWDYGCGAGPVYTGQTKLYETTNNIEVLILSGTSQNGCCGVGIGIENQAEDDGITYFLGSATIKDRIVRFDPPKLPPALSCAAAGPVYRTVPVQITGSAAMTDSPVDPESYRWWFDTAGGYDPAEPDIAYDRDGDGQQDADYSLTPTWTYPLDATPGMYTVRLEAKDVSATPPDVGATTCKVKVLNRPPVAVITPPDAFVGTTGTVTARGPSPSFDADGVTPFGGLTYEWALPHQDNCSVAAETPWQATCSWAAGESYDFLLVVIDADGAASLATLTVVPVDPVPKASFTDQPDLGTCSGLATTRLTDTSVSYGPELTQRAWDIGADGSTESTAPQLLWTFPAGGLYPVRLTVTDAEGHTASVVRDVKVTASEVPIAAFVDSLGGVAPAAGTSVHLRDTSEPRGMPLSGRLWTLPDGTTTGAAEPAFPVAGAGDYTVTLKVTDEAGCAATATRTYHVEPPEYTPPPPISIGGPGLVPELEGPDSARPQEPVTFRDATEGVAARSWSIGGRTVEGDPEVTERFAAGTHEVVLTVRDTQGRMAEARHLVVVAETGPTEAAARPAPRADAGADIVSPPAREVVLDATGSVGATAFQWRQLSGPVVSLHGAALARPTFVAPSTEGEAMVFELTVSDGTQRASDRVTVRVGAPESLRVDITDLGGGRYRFSAPGELPVTWTFGDGAVAIGPVVEHVFLAAGPYTVQAESPTQSANVPLQVQTHSGVADRSRDLAGSSEPLRFAGMPMWMAIALFGTMGLGMAVLLHAITSGRPK